MLALATVAASARKQRLFLPRLPDNEPTMLLTLSDNVLAIIRVCSQTAKGRSWYLPTTKSRRSEEHTSELQSLMRISYAVFCLKKKNNDEIHKTSIHHSTLITTNL